MNENMKFNDNDCSLTIEFDTEGKRFIDWFEYLKDADVYNDFHWYGNEKIGKVEKISCSSNNINILKFYIKFNDVLVYTVIRNMIGVSVGIEYSKKDNYYRIEKVILKENIF